jgi:hypothetical protein
VSSAWILGKLLEGAVGAAPNITWRAIRYALKHLADEGKISSYSERPPDVYYVKAQPRAAVPAINEAMETIG